MITRRNMLRGLGGAIIAAPFVTNSGILMPVRPIIEPAITIVDIDRIKKALIAQAIPTEVLYAHPGAKDMFDPSVHKFITFRRYLPTNWVTHDS